MALYYAIRAVAEGIVEVQGVFLDLWDATRTIWLIGEHLSRWFLTIALRLSPVAIQIAGVADDYLDFRQWVIDQVENGVNLGELTFWIDDLVSFISDPDRWLRNMLNWLFPEMRRLIDDPVTYVLEVIYQYTGFDYYFVQDPFGTVERMIRAALGRLVDLVDDPVLWLVDKIQDLFPTLYAIARDPDGWLLDRIRRISPVLTDFLRDPQTFVVVRVVDGLERAVDTYRIRLAKIAERVISSIF